MPRQAETKALLVLWGCLVAVGVANAGRWPTPLPALDGAVSRAIAAKDIEAARTLGVRWSLNRASAGELASVAGLGKQRAQALVEARARVGGFTEWSEVDAVPGIGPHTLRSLQDAAELGPVGP